MKRLIIIFVSTITLSSCDLFPCGNSFIVVDATQKSAKEVKYKIISIKGNQCVWLYEKPNTFNVGDTVKLKLIK